MRIILLGAPGAGKGTQAARCAAHFHIPQISTGDMLRSAIAEGSALGREAQSIMASGQLVPDGIMVALVNARLQAVDCARGFLLDGFPRTLPQAEALEEAHIHIDQVIEIAVPDEAIIQRITGRRVHVASGRVYHVLFQKPQREGFDDISGEPLVQREDDKEETVRKRLQVYRAQTEPLVAHYQEAARHGGLAPQYHMVQGEGSVDEVFARILKVLPPQ
ncbi:MAG: adenylate kinase [Legionellaceae bacterium]|nr:adenylate kinase [Legionellaceae bacterium]